MIILGVSALYHDSAATLIENGEIITAVQEERLSRKKGDWRFPERAIKHCLGIASGPLDRLAYYENPRLKAQRILAETQSNAARNDVIWPSTLQSLYQIDIELPRRLRDILNDPTSLSFVSHHRSHAASAFLPSPFEEAAVLVVDGVGEWSTASIWHGKGHVLTPLCEMKYPHSIGLFYSAFTQYCGFKVNSGEYKLMGLAPFGQPIYVDLIREKLIDLRSDGSIALNLDYFAFQSTQSTISSAFETLFGRPSRSPDEPIDRFFMDVAASVQLVLESAMLALGQKALDLTGSNRLCLAGGVALNCVANGRLEQDLADLQDIWIQPAAGDAGGALGAALQVLSSETGQRPHRAEQDSLKGAFLGPSFDRGEIEAELIKLGLHYTCPETEDELCEAVAEALDAQAIIGHFDGAMEFGPRALGNRSILADPRAPEALSRVNERIKFRESWRPFAPMILSEEAGDYFEAPTDSPYMLKVTQIKSAHRLDCGALENLYHEATATPVQMQKLPSSILPAITHVDGSSRLQSVGSDSPTRARAILEAFFARTGCPVLLNTSFNVRGEPIVCTPFDAISCFLNTHMDLLVVGPFLVRKTDQPAYVRDLVGKQSFDAD